MHALTLGGLFVVLALLPATTLAQAPPREGADLVARGQYLASIMDCGGCHTPGALAGAPDPERRLAGSTIGFAVPGVAIVYPPNLTPDPATGLGRWTDAEITRAIRQGQSRDGRALIPVMPWPSYSVSSEADAAALVAYLRRLPAVRLQTPRRVGPGEKPTAPYLTVVDPK